MAKKFFRCREYADGHRPVQEVNANGMRFVAGKVYATDAFDAATIGALESTRAAKGLELVPAIEWLDAKPGAAQPTSEQKG